MAHEMDDRIRIDKLPQPVPWPELAALLAERAGLQEKVRAAVVDRLPVHRAADAVSRTRAEAARRGEELDDDAPELLALAAARGEEGAAEVRRVALGDSLAAVDTDICALLDSKRATYLDLLGKSRAGAEERVGAALSEAQAALVELGRAQALYAYLDDWPEPSWHTGAYLPAGAELGLTDALGDPLTAAAVVGALRDAAGRPRRGRKARAVETTCAGGRATRAPHSAAATSVLERS